MKLVDVIDFEAQLAIDEQVDDDTLRQRDRTIFMKFPAAVQDDPGRLLSAWLAALRTARQGVALGTAVAAGHRVLGYVLAVIGLLTGAGAASVLLAYDGQTPVNLGGFLFVIVGVQIGLIALLLVVWLLAQVVPPLAIAQDLRVVLRLLARALEPALDRLPDMPAQTRERWRVARSRLRTRAGLYGPLERWLVVELSQLFGVAFNVGVLLACMRLILFSDLAFGWSTTAEALDAQTVFRVVRALSAPWAGLLPDAVPTFELVELSRFSRLQGGFAPGVTDALVGRWWRFVIACVVTYGLLPRLVLWGGARALRGRSQARLPLDTPDVQRVLRRLRAPDVRTRAVEPPPSNQSEPARPVAPLPPPEPSEDLPTASMLVRWRDAPAAARVVDAVERAFGYRVAGAADAGGVNLDADTDSQRQAAAQEGPVVIVAEAWEAPDKGVRRYLTGLRTAVGPSRPIFVVLVGEGEGAVVAPAAADVTIWRDRLTLLEDPYLGVEPLEVA